jgi:hypothetical protein
MSHIDRFVVTHSIDHTTAIPVVELQNMKANDDILNFINNDHFTNVAKG